MTILGKRHTERSTTRLILTAFTPNFRSGAFLWRTTHLPGFALSYRFNSPPPPDLILIATNATLLDPSNNLAALLTSWSKPWGAGRKPVVPAQSCDFDTEKGLTKAWAYMGGLRPFDDMISVADVPACIIIYRIRFHDLGLGIVRHVAVDFHSGTVVLYFRAAGPLSQMQALSFVEFVGHSSLSKSEFAEMQEYLSPVGFKFAVMIGVPTGVIKRVAFYIVGLPWDVFPDIGHRMAGFFSEAPNYDADKFRVVAWSYGAGRAKYMKAEKSCCGQVVPLLRA